MDRVRDSLRIAGRCSSSGGGGSQYGGSSATSPMLGAKSPYEVRRTLTVRNCSRSAREPSDGGTLSSRSLREATTPATDETHSRSNSRPYRASPNRVNRAHHRPSRSPLGSASCCFCDHATHGGCGEGNQKEQTEPSGNRDCFARAAAPGVSQRNQEERKEAECEAAQRSG